SSTRAPVIEAGKEHIEQTAAKPQPIRATYCADIPRLSCRRCSKWRTRVHSPALSVSPIRQRINTCSKSAGSALLPEVREARRFFLERDHGGNVACGGVLQRALRNSPPAGLSGCTIE